MSNSLSKRDNKARKNLSRRDNGSTGWHKAILDAKKRAIKRLEAAIDTLTTRRDAGEPWPDRLQSYKPTLKKKDSQFEDFVTKFLSNTLLAHYQNSCPKPLRSRTVFKAAAEYNIFA